MDKSVYPCTCFASGSYGGVQSNKHCGVISLRTFKNNVSLETQSRVTQERERRERERERERDFDFYPFACAEPGAEEKHQI